MIFGRNSFRFPALASLLTSLAISAFGADAADALPDWKQSLREPGDAWMDTDQHLVINNNSEPETLDPQVMTGSPEIRLAGALFEGLTSLDPKTLEPRPGVAERWNISPDGLEYVFTLCAGARWSDGKTLTADDFVQSWKRALTPATGSPYANLLFCISGAEALFKGQTNDFETVGVVALSSTQLQVRLSYPCAYFLELTAFPTLCPVRMDVISRHGDAWTRPENFVGNGPFVLKDWSARRHVIMTRNEHYWDRAFVRLHTVTALPLDDLNTAYQLFLKGEIDWLPAIPQARVEEVRRNPDYYVTPFFGTYFYRFNVTREPFTDKRVRRAFGLATDRAEITDHILKSGQLPVGSLCPPIAGYEPTAGLSYDRQAARDLLASVGYGEDKPFPPVEILYNTSEAHKLIAEALAQQWKRNLGITVTSRNVEWKTFLNDTKQLDYLVCRSSWIGDYGDPSTFLNCFTSEDGNNRTGWCHPEYDRLAEEAGKTADHQERLKIFHKMERILVEDECPILPIYRYVNQGMLAEHVLGWFANIRDLHNLKYVWLEKE